MVFSSVPSLYLDPPNWQQQANQPPLQGHHNNHHHHDQNQPQFISPQKHQQQQQQPNQMGIGPAAQTIRANSMSERARLAKIPAPEIPLKCPRCDSINTKFCYYNNYSLTQPRHFCKTCRRYWTRGGALRNVPVGGSCRRNNKKSSSANKSSPSSIVATSSKSATVSGEQLNDSRAIIGNSGMSFMASFENIAQLGGISNMGLTNFTSGGPVHTPNSSITPLIVGGYNQNNLDFPSQVQFPNFLGGFEIPRSSGGVYPSLFQNVGGDKVDNNMSKSSSSSSTVKMEENGQGNSIAKQLMMGISTSNDSDNNMRGNNTNQYWPGGHLPTNNIGGRLSSMWTNLSGLNSSSTTHLL